VRAPGAARRAGDDRPAGPQNGAGWLGGGQGGGPQWGEPDGGAPNGITRTTGPLEKLLPTNLPPNISVLTVTVRAKN